MSVQSVIVTRSLTRRFGETLAVDDLTLDVRRGEVLGFLGHNGAGKTTTVRLLNGVLGPSSGDAVVLGLSPAVDGPALRRRTGVLTETPSLDERLTARENLTIYADLYGVPVGEVKPRVADLLDRFGLAERADEQAGGYSKGMKQRLALARALLHRPELLFLDEPTAGLDPVAARQVLDLIQHQSRSEGHTVFLCTHNLAEAQRVCDRVAVLEHGRLVVLGAPSALGQQIGLPVRFEIETAPEDVAAAQVVLRERAGLKHLSAEGSVICAQGAARDDIPSLLAALVAAGVRVYRVAPLEASLEDVYFAIQDGHRGENHA
jgi:ABC-2 type transport system ATP-binding protein